MAKAYLENLRGLIERLPLSRRERDDVTCKHFFSGAAATVEGRIFMTLTPKGLALKLPEHDRERLMAEGAKALRYFPNAPIKRDYVILPERFASGSDSLVQLVRSSMSFSKDR